MKLRRNHRVSSGQRGAALLAALCFTLVLAIALSSYITVCYRTLQMSTRNVGASHTVELAETGMEEALWALQNNSWGTWTISGTTVTKTLPGFSYDNNSTGSASLTIDNYNSGTRTITVIGTVTQSDGTTMSRTLTSTSSQAPLFVNAVAGTTGKIKFSVAGTVDSYDSSINPDVLPTAGGQTAGYSAIISSGSVSTTSSTVQLVNAQIKGYVSMLSSSPSNLFYSSSAKIVGLNTAGGVNIDTTRVSTSPYQPIFDEVTPTAVTPLPSPTATIATGATTTQYYYATNYSLNGTQILYVDGPVVLVITGDLTISNSAKIQITTNGSLEIHLGGNLSLDGNGIQNLTKLPKKLAILETAGNTWSTWEMTTSTPFYGVIYTPDNGFTVWSAQTIYGSIVGRYVYFKASPTFHYDLNLRLVTFTGLSTPYAVSSVREIGP